MAATIVPFETRAQREERLEQELVAAYRAHVGAEAPKTWDALMQALDRLVAFQIRHSRPTLPNASQNCCVCPLMRRPTMKRN
jgi:hypothetical protein